MPFERGDREWLPGGRVPELDGPIVAARGQGLPIGAERQCPDIGIVSLDGTEFPARGRVPEPHHLVLACGSQVAALGLKCDVEDRARMPTQGAALLIQVHVPDLDRVLAVLAGRGQKLAVGTEREATDNVRVALERASNLA